MMAWLKRNWTFIVGALVVAVLVHVASVMAIPRLVMWRATGLMARNTGYNTMSHAVRATWQSRTIVRPSPDLLYSSCPFDLDSTPRDALHVHASGMPDTYWSVSVFDADTNNVYVLNDRRAKGESVDFVIISGEGDDTLGDSGPPKIWVPTARGVVLFRTLVDNEARFAEIDAARKHAACEPYVPQH